MAPISDRIVGRHAERLRLEQILASQEAEFVAVYGRRRVGKTHLIREFFEPRAETFFVVTGQKDAPREVQLRHMRTEIERVFTPGVSLPALRSWDEAFSVLAGAIEQRAKATPSSRIVVFLDELPWLSTRRSMLLQTLDHYWNTRLSRIRSLRFIVCGSAASWILDKLIHAKGGLHNRITRQLQLLPFSLAETQEYLSSRRHRWNRRQVLELYLALGGIPHYLRLVERGHSAAQAVGSLCFDRAGELHEEFERLLASLFASASVHDKIIRAAASRASGLDRNEIIAATGIPSGGEINRRLRELEEAGFLASMTPWGRRRKQTRYRLIDEFVWFYLRWIERAPRGVLSKGGQAYWLGRSQSPTFRSWSGQAFEGIVLKHADLVRAALGLTGVATETGTWRYVPASGSSEQGAQIDLLFDRDDGVIDLCELKYSAKEFVLTKAYAQALARKIAVFQEQTRTRKQVRLVLVCPGGMKRSIWTEDLIDVVVDDGALFPK